MHWRHTVNQKISPKKYSVNPGPFFQEKYFEDYYLPDAPITLHTFGLCSRSPVHPVVDRIDGYYTFYYVLCGKGVFNGVSVGERNIVFFDNTIRRNISSDPLDPCIYAWVDFLGGKSEKYLNQIGLTEPFAIYENQNQAHICQTLYEMMEIEHPEMERAMFLESCLMRLIALSRNLGSPAKKENGVIKAKDCRVTDAVQYISIHFQESNLTLKEIANAAKTSPQYLQKIFQEKVGLSIYQYITKLRLETAIDLLINDNYNITEVSYAVGFNDRRTFFELFKKHYGCSPSHYVANKSMKSKLE